MKMLLRRHRDEEGMAIIVAMLVMLVVMLLGTVAIQLAIHDTSQSSYDRKRQQAVAAAEAGLDYYLSYIQSSTSTQIASGCSATTQSLQTSPASAFTVTPTYYTSGGTAIACPFPSGTTPGSVVIKSVGRSNTSTPVRTIEAQVKLVPIAGTLYGSGAIYAYQDVSLSGSSVVNGNGGENGDVYSGGDFTSSSSTTVHGSVYAQGKATLSSGGEIKVDVWANLGVDLSGSRIVRGSVTSSTSTVKTSGSAHIYGNAKAGSTITYVAGSINGTITPNSVSPAPPLQSFPTFTYNATNWTDAGFTINNFSSCSDALDFINSAPTGNNVVRITPACSINTNATWTLKGDLAIISDGKFQMSGGLATTDGPSHTLYMFTGIGGTVGSCSNGFTMSGGSAIDPLLNTIIYTPCAVTMSSSTTVNGQVVAGGTATLSGSSTFNFIGISVPGSPAKGYVQNLAYIREVVS